MGLVLRGPCLATKIAVAQSSMGVPVLCALYGPSGQGLRFLHKLTLTRNTKHQKKTLEFASSVRDAPLGVFLHRGALVRSVRLVVKL